MVRLNFAWGFVLGSFVLVLWTIHAFCEGPQAVTTLWAGTAYDLMGGGVYLLYVAEEKDERGEPIMKMYHCGYILIAMVGGLTPFAIATIVGLS